MEHNTTTENAKNTTSAKNNTTKNAATKNICKLNPYPRIGSAANTAFEMAKIGTTRAALAKYFDKLEIGHGRLFRELRNGQFKNVQWNYRETEDGAIRLTQIRTIEPEPAKKPATKNAEPAKPAKNASPAKKSESAKKPATKKTEPAKNAEPTTEPAN